MNGDITREHILQILKEHLLELQTHFGVRRIALFGSFARGIFTEHSDVDLLVELASPLGLRFVELAEYLENLLGRKVDLVTTTTLEQSFANPRRQHIARSIVEDLLYVE